MYLSIFAALVCVAAWAFSSCDEQGLLMVVTSLAVDYGL